MTKRKTNPAKRGRRPIPNEVHRAMLLKWQRFARGKVGTKAFEEFRRINLAWFIANRIDPGTYATLRNHTTIGRKARQEQAAQRRQHWGIVVDLLGRRSFSTNALLIRYHQRRALGISNAIECTFNPELK
jgi:hypothetical protein